MRMCRACQESHGETCLGPHFLGPHSRVLYSAMVLQRRACILYLILQNELWIFIFSISLCFESEGHSRRPHQGPSFSAHRDARRYNQTRATLSDCPRIILRLNMLGYERRGTTRRVVATRSRVAQPLRCSVRIRDPGSLGRSVRRSVSSVGAYRWVLCVRVDVVLPSSFSRCCTVTRVTCCRTPGGRFASSF